MQIDQPVTRDRPAFVNASAIAWSRCRQRPTDAHCLQIGTTRTSPRPTLDHPGPTPLIGCVPPPSMPRISDSSTSRTCSVRDFDSRCQLGRRLPQATFVPHRIQFRPIASPGPSSIHHWLDSTRSWAAVSSTPVTMRTMRLVRAFNLLLVARRSTIRLPKVLPMRTIAPVVNMFSTSLVAVPAFSRVEPLKISGPTTGQIM